MVCELGPNIGSLTTMTDAQNPTTNFFNSTIKGTGAQANQACRIWVKNEHHILWRGDRLGRREPGRRTDGREN